VSKPLERMLFRHINKRLTSSSSLSSGYGTHKNQPSRPSNPANLRAALAALRLIRVRTDVMVPQTSAIAEYEDTSEEHMRDAKNPRAYGLEKKLADCPEYHVMQPNQCVRTYSQCDFPPVCAGWACGLWFVVCGCRLQFVAVGGGVSHGEAGTRDWALAQESLEWPIKAGFRSPPVS
jgi:hypothetical protein